MKVLKLYSVFLLLAFSNSSFSQIKSETNTHETIEYSITFPSKSKFVSYENKEDESFKSLFHIFNFNKSISNFSEISLSKLDCSGFSIGTAGFVQVSKKGKTILKCWNENSQKTFDEVSYEEDGFTYITHIYVNNDIVYQLTGSTKAENFYANQDEIRTVLTSFFLK